MADLRDVGLSEYEARAYRGLLERGPTTAKELSQEAGVPMGRVYDVLNGLERDRLVRSEAASRPKRYVAVDPDTALDRLLEEKRRELRREERQYENAVESLAGELDHEAEEADEGFWTAAVGADETADLLLDRLAAAEDRIVVVAAGASSGLAPREIGASVTTELATALDRGVEVSVLLGESVPGDLPRTVGERYANRLADHPRFTVRTHPEVRGTVTLLDDREVCLEVPNPVERDRTFAVIDLTDRSFAADVRDRFRSRWSDAEPFTFSDSE